MYKLIPALGLTALLFPAFLSAQWTFYTGSIGSAPYQVQDRGNVRWLCTAAGLFRSNDYGKRFQRIEGLPKDSGVGGVLLRGDSLVLTVSAPDPLNPNTKKAYLCWSVNQGATWQSRQIDILAETVYKGVQYIGDTLFVGSVARLYRSVDDGMTFEAIGPTPSQGNYRFAMNDKALFTSTFGGLYRSLDRGDSWDLVRPMNSYGNIALSGDTVFTSSSTDSVFISLDLGNTWLAAPPNPAVGTNFLNIGLNGRLFATFKSLYYSDDLGQTWIKLSDGAQNTFFGMYENADAIWAYGNSGLVRVDPADGQLYLDQDGSTGGYNQYFIKGVNDRLYACNINYKWSYATDLSHWMPQRPLPSPSSGLTYNIEHKGDTLLMLYDLKTFFSADDGQSWSPVSDSFSNPNDLMRKGDVLLVGDSKGIWRSTTVQGPWTRVTAGTQVVEGFVLTPDKWFAYTFSGNILTSDDEGLSWTISAQLGLESQNSLRNLQYGGGYVFYLGANGLMRTAADDGVNWEPTSGILPADFYSGIAELGKLLFIGTRGKGLYASSDNGKNWFPFHQFEHGYIPSVTIWQNRLVVSVVEEGLWVYETDLAPYYASAFRDENQNNVRDAGEGPFQGLIVRAQNGAFASSDSSGLIRVFGATPADSLFAYPRKYITATPARSLLSSLTDTVQLAVHVPQVQDLRLTMVNLQPLVPGRNTLFDLIAENVGLVTQDAVVTMHFPPELDYLSAVPPADSWGPDSASWLLPNFKSGDSRLFQVVMRTDTTVIPGTTISMDAVIEPIDTDFYPKDNGTGLRIVVLGSFDPNDKIARKGERITPQELEDGAPMEYIIRFQNTGTFPASFVRIADTLSSRFDPATFVFQGSSHPCRWQIKGAGILEFFFENIELPDSTADEPGSHGFVAFSIQPYPGLALGDTLANTAHIYFDYNAPVQTNTTSTVVSEPLYTATAPEEKVPGLECFPNPAGHTVHLRWPDGYAGAPGKVWIWDANGRLMQQIAVNGSETTLSLPLPGWPSGWYRVGWQRGKELRWGSFLRQ